MTTSITFSIGECGVLLGGDISHNSDPTLDPAETEWLTDPNAPRDALQRLRILKSRETGEQQQIPNITGRGTGVNINFQELSFTYEELKMRRKAEILKNKNKNFITKNKNYSNIARGLNSKSQGSSRARLQGLINSNKCQNLPPVVKLAINSGIKNDDTPLIYNKNVPYFDQI